MVLRNHATAKHLNTILPKMALWMKQGCPLLLLLFNTVLRVPARAIRHTQNSYRHPNCNGRSKLPLFADDTTLYIRNPKDSTKKLLELWNKFSQTAEYKINIQKSVVFLYNNNKLSGRERNNKCWQGCGEKGTTMHCLWELKLVQPLWEPAWRFLKKLKIELP